jgi:uncharacterized membrane protein
VLQFVIIKTDEVLGFLWSLWPKNIYKPGFPGLGLALVFIALIALGALTESVIVRKALVLFNFILSKVPFIRNIYPTLLRLMQSIFGSSSNYTKAVMIEYPRPGLYAIAFITSDTAPKLCEKTGKNLVNVFVPSSPFLSSGFYLMISSDQIIDVNISKEDAFKLVISAGIVHEND